MLDAICRHTFSKSAGCELWPIILGMPYLANKVWSASKVVSVVVVLIGKTSSHLEYASTTTRNMEPIKGLAYYYQRFGLQVWL